MVSVGSFENYLTTFVKVGPTAVKILVLSQYWHPENGVPQRRWTWLSKILVDAGHEVTVIAPPPHYQRKIELKQWWATRKERGSADVAQGPSGERIIRSGFFPAGPSLTQRAVNQATVALGAIQTVVRKKGVLKDYRPDLVIGTVPALPTAAATRIVAAVLRRPYLIDLRDAWPDLLQQSDQWNKGTGRTSLREKVLKRGPMQMVSALTQRVLHQSFKHAAGISVTSSYLAEELKNRALVQIDGKTPPIMTVRNVFPPETTFRAIPNREGPSDRLNVLYAGTLGRAQNLTNAIKAAELAKEAGVDVAIRFVGAGAARSMLQKRAMDSDVDITIEPRQPAADLAEFYEWADTALVHLTNWEPLNRAVPSKTYELMNAGMHISGVVAGEAAELIRVLNAGDVVDPEEPEQLADLWAQLARDRSRLTVTDDGAEWVAHEYAEVAPHRLLTLIDEVTQ